MLKLANDGHPARVPREWAAWCVHRAYDPVAARIALGAYLRSGDYWANRDLLYGSQLPAVWPRNRVELCYWCLPSLEPWAETWGFRAPTSSRAAPRR